jgi:hypothetical protein
MCAKIEICGRNFRPVRGLHTLGKDGAGPWIRGIARKQPMITSPTHCAMLASDDKAFLVEGRAATRY